MSEWFLSWIGILCIISSFFLVFALLSSAITLEDVIVFLKTFMTQVLPRFFKCVFHVTTSLLSKIYRKLIHMNTLSMRFRAAATNVKALPLSRLGRGPSLSHRLSLSKSPSASSSSPSPSSLPFLSSKEMRRHSKRGASTPLQQNHRISIPSSSSSSLESCKSETFLKQHADTATVDEPPLRQNSIKSCPEAVRPCSNETELYCSNGSSLHVSHLTNEFPPSSASAVESHDFGTGHGSAVNSPLGSVYHHHHHHHHHHRQPLKERRKSWEVVEPHLSLYQLPYMNYVRQTEEMPTSSDVAATQRSQSNPETSYPVVIEPEPEPEPELKPELESELRPQPARSSSVPPCSESPVATSHASSPEFSKSRLSVSNDSSAAVTRRRSSGHKERWYSPFVSGLDIELHFVQRPSNHLTNSSGLHHSATPSYDCLGSRQNVNQTFIPSTLSKFPQASTALTASTSSILSEGWLRRTSASHRSHHSHSHSHTHSHHTSHRSHQSHRAGPTAVDLNHHFSLFEKSLFMPIA